MKLFLHTATRLRIIKDAQEWFGMPVEFLALEPAYPGLPDLGSGNPVAVERYQTEERQFVRDAADGLHEDTVDCLGYCDNIGTYPAVEIPADPVVTHLASTSNPHSVTAAQTGADITANSVHAATSKPTPADADETAILDSAASYGLKKLTWASIKAILKSYFDTLYSAGSTPMLGEVRLFALPSSRIESGWLVCDGGQCPDVPLRAQLVAAGNPFGSSAGIPLLPGRNAFPMMAGGTYALGAAGGIASKTLSINEIPSHTHGLPTQYPFQSGGSGNFVHFGVSNTRYNTAQTDAAGGGAAFSILNPYIAFYFIIYGGVN